MFKLKHMYKIASRLLLPCLAVSLLLVLHNSCKKEAIYEAQTLPSIKNVLPVAGIVGTQVTIKGTNLKEVAKVRFGTVDASGFNAGTNTDSSVTVTVPAGLQPGEFDLQVSYAAGKTGYSAVKFTVLETPRPPTITGVNPGKAFPGVEVIISGADFLGTTVVKFGSVNADFTVTNTKITTKVPLTAAGGNQLITVTNATGSATFAFTVDLSPVISSISPGSGNIGDSIDVTGVRFNNITSVKVGALAAGFRSISETQLRFKIPAGSTPNTVTVTNAIGSSTSSNPLNILGLDPVLESVKDPNLVFFDFNGTGNKDLWWGDVGGIENSGSLALPGSGGYFRVNTNGASIAGWKGFFWRNGANNFPGATIGTNVNDYVLKFDIYVIDPITGGEFAWRLKGTEGDFFYSWKPWAATGSFRTFGWKTFTINISDFAEGANHITDLSKIDSDFGVALNNGSTPLNIAIDNVRFEHK